jgi:alpha-tubulin suppressor-like RCC1 family protein
LILTKSNFIYVWGSNKLGQIGIGNEDSSKHLSVLTLPKSFEDEKKKSTSSKKKKSKSYEVSKSTTASKIETKILKKSEKDKELKKNFHWKYISVSENTSFAISGKKKLFFFFLFSFFLFFILSNQNYFFFKNIFFKKNFF